MAPHPGIILSATGTAIMHLKAAVRCCASIFTYPQHAPNDPDNLDGPLELFPATAISMHRSQHAFGDL